MSYNILDRFDKLKKLAVKRYGISADKCHIGHLALEGMLESLLDVAQIDGATNTKESNMSLALRTMRLASAMDHFGLKPGDPVIIVSRNNLDISVPFFSCHYMGYSMCSVDPLVTSDDLKALFPKIKPKCIFCERTEYEKNKEALRACDIDIPIVTVNAPDDKENNLESVIHKYKGTDTNFRPATDFDTATVPAWLILTSGTTGSSKVAMIPFDTLYRGIIQWWLLVPEKVNKTMILTSTQWLTALVFTLSAPLKSYTKLQISKPVTPPLMVQVINTYKPDCTAWTPYFLARFVQAPVKICDLSCFKTILVGGAAVEKHILDQFKKICNARLILAFGMSELLGPVFDSDEKTTPFGSSGKSMPIVQYKLIDDDGKVITQSNKSGELLLKSNYFFSGYLNEPAETKQVLTDDGYVRTGDMFYRDRNGYYFFVERKKLLIRYMAFWIAPLQLEEVIKRHPKVAEVCVVGIPHAATVEATVAAVMRMNGYEFDPQEIFDLVKKSLPEHKQLHGGLFFVESFPMTPTGKINRALMKKMAQEAERIMPK